MKYDTPEAALAALRAPSDIAAGAYVHNGSPVVVRVVERDGDLAIVLDDGGEAPRTKYLGSMLSRQELVLAERFRSMPGERRFTFLALSELLSLTPDDGRTLPTIVNDAMERFADGRDSEPLDIIARKAFQDAARDLGGKA